jgi:hypothetical protein
MSQQQNPHNQGAMAQSIQPKNHGHLPYLSPEDNKSINLLTAKLVKSTPREVRHEIVENMTPDLRAALAKKAVDPIIYYFRKLATKEFGRRKQMGRATGCTGKAGEVNNNLLDVPELSTLTEERKRKAANPETGSERDTKRS